MLPIAGMMGGGGGLSASATATSGNNVGPTGYTTDSNSSGFVINYGAGASVGSGGGIPWTWIAIAAAIWMLRRK